MVLKGFSRALAVLAMGLAASCDKPAAAPAELQGNWDVQQVAGASLGEGVRIHIAIDAQSGRISGFTGCNDFTASLTSFGDMIAIGAPSETNAPCPSPAAETDETRFLMVLGSVGRFARHGRSLELLPREHGEALLLLRNTDGDAQN
jgi:heat shock protein HslJ